jgi:hypothetical protein
VSTGYYLLDNKNPHGPHFYAARRSPILAVVVHITAGLQGAPIGADSSAEKTARYAATTDRKVSWHSGSDRDSHLRLLPDDYTAFHVRGYNSTTIGHEISKRDVSWSDEHPGWVTGTLEHAAVCLAPRVKALRIPTRRARKLELDHAISTKGMPVGFISHEDLDPTRRRDPGRDFPWQRFLGLIDDINTASQPDDDEEELPVLKIGDSGPPVAFVQECLRAWGNRNGARHPYAHDVAISGQYDRHTELAVDQFQRGTGLPATGVADYFTTLLLSAQYPKEKL